MTKLLSATGISRLELRTTNGEQIPAASMPFRNPRLSIMLITAFFLALTFTAATLPAQAECGTASVYSEGTRTATGERYNPHGISAAHRTRPLGSHVRVRNMRNGREITVRIGDRGPFYDKAHRIIDLSLGAAKQLGMNGLAHVCID